MDKQESTLSTYLKQVMALKEERRRTPTEEELRSIAREIGLSDEDLVAIDQAALDHAVRGKGFLEHQRYGDAITELEEAVGVAPRRVEWLHSLAQARLGRWHEKRQPADLERAEVLARECLELDPHHAASYEVLNALDHPPSAPPAGKRIAALLSLFVFALLLIVMIAAMYLWSSGQDAGAPAVEEPGAAAVKVPISPDPAAEASAAKELDIPITLDPGSTGVVLGLDPRLSRLVSYQPLARLRRDATGKSFFTLNAILNNRGATELDKLGVRLELLDDAGTVVDRAAFEALNKAAPVLRPGDAHALHQLRETHDSVRAARLVVEIVEENPAASSYAAAPPLDVDWRAERSADLEITLRERSYRFSENALARDGNGYFDAVIEIENTGDRTIRALKLEAEIAGPGGAWTVLDANHVVTSSGPALYPGEVRLKRFIEKVEARPDGYRMFVVAVQ